MNKKIIYYLSSTTHMYGIEQRTLLTTDLSRVATAEILREPPSFAKQRGGIRSCSSCLRSESWHGLAGGRGGHRSGFVTDDKRERT